MKGLHNLQTSAGATRRKKRLGRGNASQGNYSGKGIKGQRARSGGKRGLMPRSMKQYLLRIPKARGFTSNRPEYAIITVRTLERAFPDGSSITPKELSERGLLSRKRQRVKILGGGTMKKKIVVTAHAFSASARKAIEQAGGSARYAQEDRLQVAKQHNAS